MRSDRTALCMRAYCGVVLAAFLYGGVLLVNTPAWAETETSTESLSRITLALEEALQGVPCEVDVACANDLVNLGSIAVKRPGVAPLAQRRYHLAAAAWAVAAAYYDDAASHLDDAVKAVPGDDDPALRRRAEELRAVWVLFRQGQEWYSERRFDDALATWQRVIDSHPEFAAMAMLEQVRVLAALRRVDEAWALLRKTADGYPGTRWGSQALNRLGGWLLGDGRYQEALAVFQDELRRYGDERGRKLVHLSVAQCYLGLRCPTEALASLKLAREALAGGENAGGVTEMYRREIMRQVTAAEVKASALAKTMAPSTKREHAQ